MDGSLPNSLKHIISNPDYYGSMLFLRGKINVLKIDSIDIVNMYVQFFSNCRRDSVYKPRTLTTNFFARQGHHRCYHVLPFDKRRNMMFLLL